MTAVITAYRCPKCGNTYETEEAAGACATTPIFPPDTRFFEQDGIHGPLWEVREIAGQGCHQVVSLRPHSAWQSGIRGGRGLGQGGVCFAVRRGESCRYKPLTDAHARARIQDLRLDLRAMDRDRARVEARIKALTGLVG